MMRCLLFMPMMLAGATEVGTCMQLSADEETMVLAMREEVAEAGVTDHLKMLQTKAVEQNQEVSAEDVDNANENSEEFENRKLKEAQRKTREALRITEHEFGETRNRKATRLIDEAVRQVNHVRECPTQMHEARVHLNDAKRELHSRGSKNENKREAKNHLHKALKKMKNCGHGVLLQEDEEFVDADMPEQDEDTSLIEQAAEDQVHDDGEDAWYGGYHPYGGYHHGTTVYHHSGGYRPYGHHGTTVYHHSGGYRPYGHHGTTVYHHSGGYRPYGHHGTTVVHRGGWR